MFKPKHVTYTTQVYEVLEKDPFLTAKAILQKLPALNMNQVAAALSYFRNRGVASVEPDGGELYWYLTPETDSRTKIVTEKAHFTKKYKPRARKVE